MSERTAAIIGATGLVGSHLAALLLKDDYFSTVRLIVRRPQEKTDPKTEIKLVDFNDAESLKLSLEGTDTIFCCIGTTQKKVKGDKKLYRKIDYDIPVKAARFGKEAGCEKFILVSAIGANSSSNTFYLKLKGEVEDALQLCGLRSVHIMQPSLILGDRKESRPLEKFGKVFMGALSGLLFGSLEKYKSIHAYTIATAMLAAAKKDDAGIFKYTYREMMQLAKAVK
jgi:uncharacterized protein YbjT (DUF2867 family)